MDAGNHEKKGNGLTNIPTFRTVLACDEALRFLYIHFVQTSFVFKSTKTRPTASAANMNRTAAINPILF